MAENLVIFGTTFNNATGIKVKNSNNQTVTYIKPEGTINISNNGNSIDVSTYATANVAVPTVNNQNKTVSPTESQQQVTADSGYSGLGTVTINAISDTYVGSAINRRNDTDLSVNGAIVSVPAGYYASNESKSVANGSVTTPATTITANPSISINSSGLITATASASQNVTPIISAGYISSGTAGTITVSGSNTQQLTTKSAQTYTPTTTNQTIASGQYLTGTQTISGDADLIATNIKSGVSIFNVNGTYTSDATASATDIINGETAYVNGNKLTGSLVVNYYYTGNSAPSSSLGNNGDIYLQV